MNDFQFNIIIALIPVLGLILTAIVGNVARKYGKKLDLNAASYWTKIAVSIFEDRYGKGTSIRATAGRIFLGSLPRTENTADYFERSLVGDAERDQRL